MYHYTHIYKLWVLIYSMRHQANWLCKLLIICYYCVIFFVGFFFLLFFFFNLFLVFVCYTDYISMCVLYRLDEINDYSIFYYNSHSLKENKPAGSTGAKDIIPNDDNFSIVILKRQNELYRIKWNHHILEMIYLHTCHVWLCICCW